MYTEIADFYNREMPEKYYADLASFFMKMMKKYARPVYADNNIVLDCGCGTGKLTRKLAASGYDMIGLDMSEDMLDAAMEEDSCENGHILWLCQDMTKMNLFGTVAGIICATDTVSHLTDEKKLKKFFALASNYTEPGGIFVFDILTENYFKNKIDGNVFFVDDDEGMCIWQGKYNPKSKICAYTITYFEKNGDFYERSDETVKEKAYSPDFLKESLEGAGFEIISITGGIKGEKVTENTERVYFTVKKPKTNNYGHCEKNVL